MFITFEGIEGAGKTTQIQKLADHLTAQGQSVVVTREPGGTPIGKRFRELILDTNTVFQSNLTELFLFFADRFEHIESVIKPALADGKVVLCDRYMDSTIAYQVGGRGLDLDRVSLITNMVDLVPDRTFLLDLPPEEGLSRAKKRAALDRFEQEELAFHYRVRETFLSIAKKEPQRVCCLDVQGKDPETIFNTLKNNL